ncbi:hypothetical protein [Jiangella asiatica]|uniref:Uncharacterized protein n=1 Tax=Jiangella asiatica TaxID=2530372 RepID=A0A4R5CP26_9ACTN|nr:hypothetical protein [Jiangella asiatica]TDE01137.1 hypothetical protein E1269_23525 [Jiangella asiatica]
MTFEVRALEFNGRENVWKPARVLAALDYMVRTGLNTFVLNDISIAERLVYPGRYFGSGEGDTNVHARYARSFRALYEYMPGGRSRRYKDVEYVRWVIRRATERDIDVYLNNKEIFFPDAILELRPELRIDGVVCPTHPFWGEFLSTKYTELYQDLPGLTGMITSPATGESRVSIAHNHCPCDRCAAMSPSEWYEWIITSMYGPSAEYGKRLVVRDFVFDRRTQNDLAAAWKALPGDIVVCLKNTPHDYYPTFPHNPRISADQGREQWVEFDSMGQYFGWGVAPAIIIDDTRRRFGHAAANGVTGVLNRVDWEAQHGHSCFETPNILNLYAFAALSLEAATTDEDIFRAWLADADAVAPGGDVERCVTWLTATLGQSWPVVAGALYAHGCVFSDSSTFPVSVEHAFWLGEEKNSRRDWDPVAFDALASDPANVRSLLAEKDDAVALVRRLRARVESENPGLTVEFYDDLVERFGVFELYITGFWHAMRCAALGRHLRDFGRDADPQLAGMLDEVLRGTAEYCDRLDTHAVGDTYPACLLLSGQRLRALHDDVSRVAAG